MSLLLFYRTDEARTGSLNKTLDDLGKSIAGAVEIKGSLAKTLDGVSNGPSIIYP